MFILRNRLLLSSFIIPAIALSPLTQASSTTEHSGEGTFYSYGGGGNCSFPTDDSILTTAINATDYNGSQACGGMILVTSTATGKSVKVRVDDQCPECSKGDLDLDQTAFAKIDDTSKGNIPITWHYIANNNAGDIKLYFKEGSSQWWTAVQVRDSRYRITKLEYRQSNTTTYTTLPRTTYNYFLASSGFGTGPYDFRITDSKGQSIEVYNIPLTVTTEIDTGKQLPKSS
ncbi:MAG: Expansin-YoaJ [Candidatus Celerinatantimonas neptuna]|nr:MAG: Expansin-YoaJ [Candidatus Celerinatantimonas neptuna]